MPIADPEKRKVHAREWARKRRAAWLAEQVCTLCGSKENLHVFGAKKLGGSAFTSSPARREKLLADVTILCDNCCEHGENGSVMLPASMRPAPKPRPTTRAGRRGEVVGPVGPTVVAMKYEAEWQAEPKSNGTKPTKPSPAPKSAPKKRQAAPKNRRTPEPRVAADIKAGEGDTKKSPPNPLTTYANYREYEERQERRERMKRERDARRKALGYG